MVNSFIILGSTGVVNSSARGQTSSVAVEEQVEEIMQDYKRDRKKAGFSIDLHETLSSMITRVYQYLQDRFLQESAENEENVGLEKLEDLEKRDPEYYMKLVSSIRV